MSNRNDSILRSYRAGNVIHVIAERFKITPQRVQQILSTFPEYRDREHNNSSTERVSVMCKWCKRRERVNPSRAKIYKYCSERCNKKATAEKWATMRKRTCSECHTEKTIDEFYVRVQNGIEKAYSRCKECHNIRVRNWMKANPERAREIQRKATAKWYAVHKSEKPI